MNSVVSVASLVSASAVAAPEIAAVAAQHPDAKLLTLGRVLDRYLEDWAAQRLSDRMETRDLEDKVYAATGVSADEIREQGPESPHYAKFRELIRESTAASGDPDLERWSALHKRRDRLVGLIFVMRARTIEGLAVKAKAAACEHQDLWDTRYRDGDRILRDLVESALALAGVALPATLVSEHAG